MSEFSFNGRALTVRPVAEAVGLDIGEGKVVVLTLDQPHGEWRPTLHKVGASELSALSPVDSSAPGSIPDDVMAIAADLHRKISSRDGNDPVDIIARALVVERNRS